MPTEHTLRYLPVAQDDLRSILDFIAQDNPSRAASFIEELDTKIGLLEEQPLLGRTPRHPKLREYGYRVLMLDAYLVFYIIRGQAIEIHRVIHGSRNMDHLI